MKAKTKLAASYRRPPKETQFKKGQSGNPKGRPKGIRNLSAALTQILNENVTVKRRGRTITATKLEAAVRQLVDKAIDGDARVLAQLLAEIHKREAKAEEADDSLDSADRETIKALYARIARELAAPKPE